MARRRSGSSRVPSDRICVRCGRPFAWRKKWERVWDRVKYCSERCRRERSGRDDARIEACVARRLDARRGSLCPSEVSRELWPDGWRERMEQVRIVGRRLEAEERIIWTQQGRRIDPRTARGPVRFARGEGFGDWAIEEGG